MAVHKDPQADSGQKKIKTNRAHTCEQRSHKVGCQAVRRPEEFAQGKHQEVLGGTWGSQSISNITAR